MTPYSGLVPMSAAYVYEVFCVLSLTHWQASFQSSV